MFAYCVNNPINFFDSTGDIPQAVEDKIVHDQVLKNICGWDSDLSYTETCVYYNGENWFGGFGYCDLYNRRTGEVWELKKNTVSYTCSTPVAQAQLKRYTNGTLKHHPELELTTPNQTIIPTRTFEFSTAYAIYHVTYWYEGDGILRYSYTSKKTELGYVLSTLELGLSAFLMGLYNAYAHDAGLPLIQ